MTVEKSFHTIADHDLSGIAVVLNRARSYLAWDVKTDVPVEYRADINLFETNRTLLNNSVQSLEAALLLMQHGYRLQPGILIRPIVESLAYVVHLFKKQPDLGEFKAGRLKAKVALETSITLAPNL